MWGYLMDGSNHQKPFKESLHAADAAPVDIENVTAVKTTTVKVASRKVKIDDTEKYW